MSYGLKKGKQNGNASKKERESSPIVIKQLSREDLADIQTLTRMTISDKLDTVGRPSLKLDLKHDKNKIPLEAREDKKKLMRKYQ